MLNPVVNDASDRATTLLRKVESELARAMALHGSLKSEHEAYAVILEEVDEFWELVKVNPKKLSPSGQKDRMERMKAELIQVAAMALRTIIDLELD